MTTSSEKARRLVQYLNTVEPMDDLLQNVLPNLDDLELIKNTDTVPSPLSWTQHAMDKRIGFIEKGMKLELEYLTGRKQFTDVEGLRGNIENYIGMTQVPTGIIGPLLVHGTQSKGDYFVPMATSEGALVASYNRGAKACRMSGGITSVCLTEAVQRAPLFKFNNLSEAGAFATWVLQQLAAFRDIVSRTSRFAKLDDMKLNMQGNELILVFEYTTGDAAGQNMVTVCTNAICQYIVANTPTSPRYWFIESNYSGDKKATAVSFVNVRGKKVTAEITMPRKVVNDHLRSTPEMIAAYWQSSSVAAVQSGSIGIQGHFANGLTAIFMATGQDVACVSEASVGVTRMEVNEAGDLYATVTLPNMIVGTVGGGTGLPTQRECLRIMTCEGTGKARRFAEICGATVLAGELSIAASIASGDFAKSHMLFGRKHASAPKA
ncbi:MAG TPA: hypothetical protein VEY71_00330 [Chitinophagales bacterium]|nr:hypothetical protein [Chitinophagales bacterium]